MILGFPKYVQKEQKHLYSIFSNLNYLLSPIQLIIRATVKRSLAGPFSNVNGQTDKPHISRYFPGIQEVGPLM